MPEVDRPAFIGTIATFPPIGFYVDAVGKSHVKLTVLQ